MADKKSQPDPADPHTALLSGIRIIGPEQDPSQNFFAATPSIDSALSSVYPSLAHDALSRGVATPPAAKLIHLRRGTEVRHYELIRELGRGGMGVVFLARDTKLGRRVAIKFINTASPTLATRFIAEARATAQCTHENIVVIHEVDVYQNLPYMVLEYLEGRTIKPLLKGKPLSPPRALEVMIPVVRALVRAHTNGIVHRDLKPDNIFMTRSGQVKVLDFGLAKVLEQSPSSAQTNAPPVFTANASDSSVSHHDSESRTQDGVFVGTPPYMSPEQLGIGEVDHRSDIWAVGIILYRMLAGRHPLDKVTDRNLWKNAQNLDTPTPSIATHVQAIDPALARIVDGCLQKRIENRWPSAQHLLDALLAFQNGSRQNQFALGESPYPGLHPFNESDATRFFGRRREVARVVAKLRRQPLIGVVGPSGVGKSSLVRAGVVPALKSSGDPWRVQTIRPGRTPLLALARLISADEASATQLGDIANQLRKEPGLLGRRLRKRARRDGHPFLLFVDQFEELYTQEDNSNDRAVFTTCLQGVADDTASPLRVLVSMRSDFLDRVSESQHFADQLTRGLVLLSSPDRAGLRKALIQPLEMTNYQFEDDHIVDAMLDELASSPGALPLLQFAAARLWDLRDQHRRQLTNMSYLDIGGVGGALASHADDVLVSLGTAQQSLVRNLFTRMVTPERTRAIVDIAELQGLSPIPGQVANLLQRLVAARLVVIQNRGDGSGPAAEIVHESLISRWPTLARWLDESEGDLAFRQQLTSAAKQWNQQGRAQGLLWRGQTALDANHWRRRTAQLIDPIETAFLDDVFALGNRATRRKRFAVIAVMVALLAVAVGASIAMLRVSQAERDASMAAERASLETERARSAEALVRKEKDRALAAELEIKNKLKLIESTNRDRIAAESATDMANQEVAQTKGDLATANKQLKRALRNAERAKRLAESAAADQRKLAAKNQRLLDKERSQLAKLRTQLKKIQTRLK